MPMSASPTNFTISDIKLVGPRSRKIFCYRPEIFTNKSDIKHHLKWAHLQFLRCNFLFLIIFITKYKKDELNKTLRKTKTF